MSSTIKELEVTGANLSAEVKRLTKANKDLVEENRQLCAKARDHQRSTAIEQDKSVQQFQVYFKGALNNGQVA